MANITNPFIKVITLDASAANNGVYALLTAAGYVGPPNFSQLMITPIAGTVSASNSSTISSEADGFPLDVSINLAANRATDGGSMVGVYLFSAGASQKIAVWARPLIGT